MFNVSNLLTTPSAVINYFGTSITRPNLSRLLSYPAACTKKLSDWGWAFLYAKHYLTEIQRKCQEIAQKKDVWLNENEVRFVLTAFIKWSKADPPLTQTEKTLIGYLTDQHYLDKAIDLKARDPEKFSGLLGACERHLNSLSIGCFIYDIQLADAYLPRHLFMPIPQAKKELLRLDENEFQSIVNLVTKKNVSIDDVETIVKILLDPKKAELCAKVPLLSMSEPFLIGNHTTNLNIVSMDVGTLFYLETLCATLKKISDSIHKYDFAAIRQQLEAGTLDLKTCAAFRQFSHIIRNFDAIDPSKYTSQVARDLIAILKTFRSYPNQFGFEEVPHLPNTWGWMKPDGLELHTHAITQLRIKIEKKEGLAEKDFSLFGKVMSCMLCMRIENYDKYQSFLTTKWPTPLYRELAAWKSVLPEARKDILAANWGDILKRMQTTYPDEITQLMTKLKSFENQDLRHSPQKLTLHEYYLCEALSTLNRNFSTLLEKHIKDNIELYLQLSRKRELKPYVHVCVSGRGEFPNEIVPGQKPTRWERIIDKIRRIVFNIMNYIFPYGHANFLVCDGHKFTSVGLMVNGIYHRHISARFNPQIEEYDIDPTPLLPLNATEEQTQVFSAKFFENLRSTLSKEYSGFRYPQSYLKYFLTSYFYPRSAPDELHLCSHQKRELFCSEFVTESIVTAHVKTCEQLKMPVPDSLSFYGISQTKGISPYGVRTALLRKGILKPF